MAEAGCRVGCLRADPPLVILCVLELSAKHVLLPLHRLLPFFFQEATHRGIQWIHPSADDVVVTKSYDWMMLRWS